MPPTRKIHPALLNPPPIDPNASPADIDRATLQHLLAAVHQVFNAVCDLAETLALTNADDDRWVRMPPTSERCRFTGWSRSTIYRLIRAGYIRAKTVNNTRYYSGTDARELVANSPDGTNHIPEGSEAEDAPDIDESLDTAAIKAKARADILHQMHGKKMPN